MIATIEPETTQSLRGLLLCAGDNAARQVLTEFLHDLGLDLAVFDVAADEDLSGALDNASFALAIVDDHPSGDWLFHLGFCAGRVGIERIIQIGSAPSAKGLAYLALDPGGGWQLALARQLKRSGVPIDLNRLC